MDELGTVTASQTVTTTERDKLIYDALELVDRIAHDVIKRMPPWVEYDDIHSAGVIGLIQSAETFDASLGTSFQGYAAKRVRGAMMDELRSSDTISRYWRTISQTYNKAHDEIQKTGTEKVSSETIAEHIGQPLETVNMMNMIVQRAHHVSLYEPASFKGEDGHDATHADQSTSGITNEEPVTPEDIIISHTDMDILHVALQALPLNHRRVITRLFFHNEQGNRIAESLGVDESRVSQIRREALIMLKEGIGLLNDDMTRNMNFVGRSNKVLYLNTLTETEPVPYGSVSHDVILEP